MNRSHTFLELLPDVLASRKLPLNHLQTYLVLYISMSRTNWKRACSPRRVVFNHGEIDQGKTCQLLSNHLIKNCCGRLTEGHACLLFLTFQISLPWLLLIKQWSRSLWARSSIFYSRLLPKVKFYCIAVPFKLGAVISWGHYRLTPQAF